MVSVVVLALSAELKHVCVPRQKTAVFIEGRINNQSEYELPAGHVRVFMDNQFVTETSLGLISPHESFDCVLGIDSALKVTYRDASRTAQEAPHSFAELTRTITRTATTTVANGHTFNVTPLIVRDAIPRGDETANFRVVLRKPEGLAHAKEGEEICVPQHGKAALVGDAALGNLKVRWTRVVEGRGGEKDGLYEWVCTVPARTKVELEAE